MEWTSRGSAKSREISFASASAVGLGALIFVGGMLNELNLLYPWVLRLVSLAGALTGGMYFGKQAWSHFSELFRGSPRWIVALGILALAVFLFSYLSGGASRLFMIHDDLHAYLVYPLRALQTGSIEPDPFSARRIESALGGMSFLDSLFLSWAGIPDLDFVDLGLGFLLLLLVALDIGERRGLSSGQRVAVVFFVALIPLRWVNLSAHVFGAAFFLALIDRLLQLGDRPSDVSSRIQVAILAAALISLKSTFIPITLVLLGLAIVAAIWRHGVRTARGFAGVALLIALLVLPWMLSLHRSAGTYLYPFLGRGFHAEFPQTLEASHAWDFVRIFPWRELSAVSVLIAAAVFAERRLSAERKFLLATAAAFALLTEMLGYVTDFWGIPRYTQPFWLAGILAAYLYGGKNRFAVPLLALAFILTNSPRFAWDRVRQHAGFLFTDRSLVSDSQIRVRRGANDPLLLLDLRREQAEVRTLQNAVPAGAPFLARLSSPFLLDFARNPIFVPDFPGVTGPPPGMPIGQGPEAVSNYLLANSIHYVAYSYRDQAHFTPELIRSLQPTGWIERQAQGGFDFQANLSELAKTRRVLLNDGDGLTLQLN